VIAKPSPTCALDTPLSLSAMKLAGQLPTAEVALLKDTARQESRQCAIVAAEVHT